MRTTHTVYGQLRIPRQVGLLHTPGALLDWLWQEGVLPVQARQRRLRQDFESGGWVLEYEVTVQPMPTEEPVP